MTAVLLQGDELEVVRAEVEAVRSVVRDGDYRQRLDTLADKLDRGEELGDVETEELDRLITLALQSGRVRALYGPGGEQAAIRAYRKLPGGAGLTASARAVSEALDALAGRTLERVTLSAVGPGAFTLSLAAGEAEVTVRLDRHGARVASVGV